MQEKCELNAFNSWVGPIRSLSRGLFAIRRETLRGFVAFVAGWMALALPTFHVCASPLSSEQFVALSAKCAPAVSVNILKAVAGVESHFDPLALRNNTWHLVTSPISPAASVQQAKKWISQGTSVDLGLMQINSGNLAALGLTVETALDPCRSLEAGARILSAAYARGTSATDRQAALLIALSRYNTGHPLAGLTNGYAGQVLAAHDDLTKTISKSSDFANSKQPDWDIWAGASAAQHDGAAWLVGSQDTPNFLIGAGAQPTTGEPHALSQEPGTAPGM